MGNVDDGAGTAKLISSKLITALQLALIKCTDVTTSPTIAILSDLETQVHTHVMFDHFAGDGHATFQLVGLSRGGVWPRVGRESWCLVPR